jgi:His/Glu/Gln/Arg/opine family amino acid ABC transporter permease subunit
MVWESLLTDLVRGLWVTVYVSFTAIAIGFPIGLGLALTRISNVPVVPRVVAVYVSLTRAVPLVTLSLFVFFGLPAFGAVPSPVVAGIIALTISTSGFQAEIWRSVLSSFPRDQLEAAKAGGMPYLVAFRRIVFPQAARAALPALMNETTLLIKASPAVSVIGVVDLTRAAVRVSAVTYEPLLPFLSATVIYVAGVMMLISLQRYTESAIVRKYGVL